MATTYTLNFYIDFLDGTTKKITEDVTAEKFNSAGENGKKWRNRIINETSDLVYPYAYYYFSHVEEKEGGYGMIEYTDSADDGITYGGRIYKDNLIHARDCRLTGIAAEETTIFGTWEV